jgi:hypothetical protein
VIRTRRKLGVRRVHDDQIEWLPKSWIGFQSPAAKFNEVATHNARPDLGAYALRRGLAICERLDEVSRHMGVHLNRDNLNFNAWGLSQHAAQKGSGQGAHSRAGIQDSYTARLWEPRQASDKRRCPRGSEVLPKPCPAMSSVAKARSDEPPSGPSDRLSRSTP